MLCSDLNLLYLIDSISWIVNRFCGLPSFLNDFIGHRARRWRARGGGEGSGGGEREEEARTAAVASRGGGEGSGGGDHEGEGTGGSTAARESGMAGGSTAALRGAGQHGAAERGDMAPGPFFLFYESVSRSGWERHPPLKINL